MPGEMASVLPKTLDDFLQQPEAFLETLQKDSQAWSSIPLLNYTPLHALKEASLVRFRGMIQDMTDPEFYLETYEVVDEDESIRLQSGKYRDCYVLKGEERVNYDSKSNNHKERRSLFLVSLPGINPWTHAHEEEMNRRNIPAVEVGGDVIASSETGVKKRSAPEETAETKEESSAPMEVEAETTQKRVRTEAATTEEKGKKSSALGAEYMLNSPIPDRPGKGCLVKIYKDFDAHVLNSLVDVVGFLSADPALDGSTVQDDEMMDSYESVNEFHSKNPPPSLIPRLHAIHVEKLPHPNPLLGARLHQKILAEERTALDMASVSKDLHTLLKLCLFNDDLAANYLLSHLMSTVYNRTEMDIIGKFSLNLCNLPNGISADYTKNLYEVLALLLPASHYLPLTLEAMNTTEFLPKKDYQTNKLVSGLLQLAPQTHLILDETKLQQGKLESHGVESVRSLAHLINQQQLKCNFEFFDINYNVDIPILVLSEGRSMLPNDFAVPLKTDADAVSVIDETFKAAHHFLNPTRLDKIRRFLTHSKIIAFDMAPEQSERIQTDFVEMRKAKAIKTGEELSALLVFSRLLAIARGQDTLDQESWQLAKDFEVQRRQRLSELPTKK